MKDKSKNKKEKEKEINKKTKKETKKPINSEKKKEKEISALKKAVSKKSFIEALKLAVEITQSKSNKENSGHMFFVCGNDFSFTGLHNSVYFEIKQSRLILSEVFRKLVKNKKKKEFVFMGFISDGKGSTLVEGKSGYIKTYTNDEEKVSLMLLGEKISIRTTLSKVETEADIVFSKKIEQLYFVTNENMQFKSMESEEEYEKLMKKGFVPTNKEECYHPLIVNRDFNKKEFYRAIPEAKKIIKLFSNRDNNGLDLFKKKNNLG